LLVKRVVGVERDVLHLGDKSGLINGVTLEYEGPVPSEFLDDCVTSGAREVRIPEGQFFVLGDNQSQSIDSRNFGPIDREAIRGKAIKIFWSFDEGRGKIRWARIGLSR
jgi:signal peptidase I